MGPKGTNKTLAPTGLGLICQLSSNKTLIAIFCFRIQDYMLSLMNEVDPCLLLPLCILYEMQNQIFQQFEIL